MQNTKQETKRSTALIKSGLITSETYEFEWNIENFALVQQKPDLLFAQRFSIETDSNSPFHSKWAIGLCDMSTLRQTSDSYARDNFRLGCKLEQICGDVAECYVSFSAKFPGDYEFKELQEVKQGERILIPYDLHYNSAYASDSKKYTDVNGTLNLKIQLQLLTPIPANFGPNVAIPMEKLKLSQVD